MTINGWSEELVSRCIECDLAEPESLASLGGSAPGLVDGILSPHIGFCPSDVNACSLRAGGAMALLCGRMDADTIRLVGRWKSDAMFCYLHAQALLLVQHLAHTMLTHGAFSLLPGTDLPPGTPSLPTHPP